MAKSKTWTFILYPEDEGYTDLLAYLKSNNVEGIRGFFITHVPQPKKDKETGEILLNDDGTMQMTKEHTHVCIQFPNARSQKGVCKALCFPVPEKQTKKIKKKTEKKDKDGQTVSTSESEIEVEEEVKTDVNYKSDDEMHQSKKVFSVSDCSSLYYYFMHWTYACQHEGKERYEKSDIQLLGNDSPDFVLVCEGKRELTNKIKCAELLQKSENIKDCRSLLMNCIDDEELVKFLVKNPYFTKTFIMKG